MGVPRGNLFGGTFGVAYALFLLTTGLLLRFFAPTIITGVGANAFGDAFGDAFGAGLLMWAVVTAVMAVGARTPSTCPPSWPSSCWLPCM